MASRTLFERKASTVPGSNEPPNEDHTVLSKTLKASVTKLLPST